MPDLSSPTTDPFVVGNRLRWRVPPRIDLLCLSLLTAFIALPLRGLYAATGSSMEEGFMLVFPERLVAGDVPNVDFLHLYGPGSLHALAGWYGLFGHSLASQRTFGLLQHLGIIFAIYALARVWGHLAAVACAVACTLLILTPIGLSALAWEGGVALGLWSVVFALRSYNLSSQVDGHAGGGARRSGPPSARIANRNVVYAAILAGLALCFRPDLIIALTLAHGWMLWRRRSRSTLRTFAAGLTIGLIPFFVHLAMAGIANSFQGMVIDSVVHLRPGRELPRPPSWGIADGALQAVAEGVPPWWRFPALAASKQLFMWFFAMLIAAVGTVFVARRVLRSAAGHDADSVHLDDPDRATATRRGVALMMGALFGLGILPQALQRPDSTHLAWVVCISFSLLPVTLFEVLRGRLPKLTVTVRQIVAIAAVAVLFFVVCPFFTYRAYILHSRVSVGNLPVPFQVQRNDRQFWVGDYFVGQASNEVIADLDAMAEPGERLLVGPADLARTIYSDVMFYYFFPELTPATYYIEMDPGLADKKGSSLAADVRSADWLILTNFWTGWNEPNASSQRGSDAPNQVVANDFCLIEQYPRTPDPNYPSTDSLVLLYHRCQQGDGISPAEVGEISALERAAGQ